MAGRDFYHIPGLERTASQDDIRSAYRKLARKYHPDINPGNKDAEEKFKEISWEESGRGLIPSSDGSVPKEKVAEDILEKIDQAYSEDVRKALRL